MCQQRNCVSPKQANRAASYIDGLHARCVGPLPGSIKRLIDALDVPLPNGPLDIRQCALAQADLVEPIIVTLSLMTRQAVPTKSSPDPSIRRSRAVSASVATSQLPFWSKTTHTSTVGMAPSLRRQSRGTTLYHTDGKLLCIAARLGARRPGGVKI